MVRRGAGTAGELPDTARGRTREGSSGGRQAYGEALVVSHKAEETWSLEKWDKEGQIPPSLCRSHRVAAKMLPFRGCCACAETSLHAVLGVGTEQLFWNSV